MTHECMIQTMNLKLLMEQSKVEDVFAIVYNIETKVWNWAFLQICLPIDYCPFCGKHLYSG